MYILSVITKYIQVGYVFNIKIIVFQEKQELKTYANHCFFVIETQYHTKEFSF